MEVKDEVFHSLLLEFFQCLGEFFCCSGGEAIDADVAYVVIYHIRGIEAKEWNFVADDVELERIGYATAYYSKLYSCVFGASQTLHDVFSTHFDTCNNGVVNSSNTVTCQDTDLF